jgi:hypothetical protein
LNSPDAIRDLDIGIDCKPEGYQMERYLSLHPIVFEVCLPWIPAPVLATLPFQPFLSLIYGVSSAVCLLSFLLLLPIARVAAVFPDPKPLVSIDFVLLMRGSKIPEIRLRRVLEMNSSSTSFERDRETRRFLRLSFSALKELV